MLLICLYRSGCQGDEVIWTSRRYYHGQCQNDIDSGPNVAKVMRGKQARMARTMQYGKNNVGNKTIRKYA